MIVAYLALAFSAGVLFKAMLDLIRGHQTPERDGDILMRHPPEKPLPLLRQEGQPPQRITMMNATSTTTGHTLSINDVHLDIAGDLDTMDQIPEAEIDAYCALHGYRCTYEPSSETSYRLV